MYLGKPCVLECEYYANASALCFHIFQRREHDVPHRPDPGHPIHLLVDIGGVDEYYLFLGEVLCVRERGRGRGGGGGWRPGA